MRTIVTMLPERPSTDQVRSPGRYKLRVKLLGQDRVLVPPGTIRLHRAKRNLAEDCRQAQGGTGR